MRFKKWNLLVLLILTIAILSFIGCHASNAEKEIEIIYLEEPDHITYPKYYNWAIKYYPSNLVISPIVDHTDAAEKGQRLWENELQGYGTPKSDDPVNPGSYVEVFYVPEEGTWVICGTSPDYGKPEPSWTGILPIAIIQQDGTVLAVGWI